MHINNSDHITKIAAIPLVLMFSTNIFHYDKHVLNTSLVSVLVYIGLNSFVSNFPDIFHCLQQLCEYDGPCIENNIPVGW